MGLLDRFLNRVRIPAFTVSIYGKLPCHKEYFHVAGHPLFAEVKTVLDQGFERLIRLGAKRPYVSPDIRFYFRMNDPKTDLAGCIFESDDGLRGFPFVIAVPLPAKLCRGDFYQATLILEPLWRYLEAYFEHLRKQNSSSEVYNRVVDVIHELDPITLNDRQASGTCSLKTQPDKDIQTLPLNELNGTALEDLNANLDLSQTPGMILWPCAGWREQAPEHATIYFGMRGLPDLAMDYFGENARQTLSAPSPEPEQNEPEMKVRKPPGLEPEESEKVDIPSRSECASHHQAIEETPDNEPSTTEDEAENQP